MKKKKTYRPSYRMGGRSYKDKKMKSGDDNYANVMTFLTSLIGDASDPIGNLIGASSLQNTLQELSDIAGLFINKN